MLPGKGIYIPTLSVRSSEMNGIQYLPSISKDRMVPVFLLAPWRNSGSLGKTIERIELAFPNRQFFLDFDRDYRPNNPDPSPAQVEWIRLRNPSDEFQAWREFWIDHPMVMPCLQIDRQGNRKIKDQIEFIQDHERQFCLRLELDRIPKNIQSTVDALAETGTADFMVVIEGGWVEDPLTMYARAHGLITNTLGNLDGRVPIAVSCTSMRKSFSDIEGVVETSFSNHQLLGRLIRDTNKEILLYGDWGSTRPRDNDFGRRPFPRIDYATDESWHFARNKERDWDYRRAAMAIVSSDAWDGRLGIWGEEMIQNTAGNPAFAIDTPQKNVAARVNIHLHRQALHGEDISGMDLDEDWAD